VKIKNSSADILDQKQLVATRDNKYMTFPTIGVRDLGLTAGLTFN